MDTVDVVVGLYGQDPEWLALSKRADDSVFAQTVWGPGLGVFSGTASRDSLSEARNHCAGLSKAEWLIFLDADDELDPGYVEAMLAREGDVRWPSTLGVVDGIEDDEPVLLQPPALLDNQQPLRNRFDD